MPLPSLSHDKMDYLGQPTFLLSHLFLSCSTPLPQALGNPNPSITCPQTKPLRTHLLLVSLLRGQHSCLLGCRNLGSFLSLLPQGPHLVCSIFHESPLEPFLVSILDIPVHLLFRSIYFAVSTLGATCLLPACCLVAKLCPTFLQPCGL